MQCVRVRHCAVISLSCAPRYSRSGDSCLAEHRAVLPNEGGFNPLPTGVDPFIISFRHFEHDGCRGGITTSLNRFSVCHDVSLQSSIQCLLHWRFTLNDNGIIRGNGTWGAEEDQRLRKLAPVFSSPATGPRYALPTIQLISICLAIR